MKKLIIFFALILVFNSCNTNSTEKQKINQKEELADTLNSIQKNESNAKQQEENKIIQQSRCSKSDLNVYLGDSATDICDTPGVNVVLSLCKNSVDIEYFLVITEAQDGWFKLKGPIGGMENDIHLPNNEGWIHSSAVSVGTRNYGGQELELLDTPENGKSAGIIKGLYDGVQILDVCGEWVKVEVRRIIGWIEDIWLCGNPLTTCS